MCTIQVEIEGMSCGHCTAAVEKAIQVLSGVEQVEVSLNPGLAVIQGTVDPSILLEAIHEEGYEARIIN